MPVKIEVEGIDEIRSRFARFPNKFRTEVKRTMEASLIKIWENIPEYPPPLPNQRYVRTGTLGRSLGGGGTGGQSGDEGGGRGMGRPDIYSVTQGGKFTTGEFGTRTQYAADVIGQTQKPIHQGRWWTMHVTVLKKVIKPLEKLWTRAVEEMARWLDGQSL